MTEPELFKKFPIYWSYDLVRIAHDWYGDCFTKLVFWLFLSFFLGWLNDLSFTELNFGLSIVEW